MSERGDDKKLLPSSDFSFHQECWGPACTESRPFSLRFPPDLIARLCEQLISLSHENVSYYRKRLRAPARSREISFLFAAGGGAVEVDKCLAVQITEDRKHKLGHVLFALPPSPRALEGLEIAFSFPHCDYGFDHIQHRRRPAVINFQRTAQRGKRPVQVCGCGSEKTRGVAGKHSPRSGTVELNQAPLIPLQAG